MRQRKILWIGSGLALLYWMVDAIMDALVFHHTTLESQLFAPTKDELWTRIFTSTLLVLFAFFAQRMINRHLQLDKELQKQGKQLADAQRVARIGSWERDLVSNKITMSDEMLRILEKDPKEGTTDFTEYFNMIHAEDRDGLLTAIQGAVSGGKPYSIDYRLVRKDQSEITIHAQGEVVHDENGKPVLFRGTAQDITERKQTEEALKAAIVSAEDEKARSESIIAAIGDGISIQGTDYRVLYQNPIHKKMVGDHIGDLCYQAIHKKDQTCSGCPVAMAFADGGIHTLERTAITDKGTIYAEVTASPLRDSTGRIIGGIESARNITERKKMEESLLQIKQDWEDAFNTITDMITVHDKDFNIIRSNKAADKILNLPFLKTARLKCYEFYHGTGSPPTGCPSCQCLQTGEPSTTELFEPHLNRLLEIRAIPRFDGNNKLIGLIHVVRDITQQKKAQEENTKLETQLRHAQKMESIGLLAGGIAHDFNNILTAIIGYGNLLHMKVKDNETLKGYAEQILESSERAAHLTQSILAFSRKQILHTQPVDVNEIVGRVKKFLSRLIGEDIHFKAILTGVDLVINADSGQIEQVLMNLATNARDAMPNGGSLIIETSKEELPEEFVHAPAYGSPGKYAVVSVTDTGTGFDENTRQRIFEPFFTTKELGKWTGLGLSIAYGIVKQHNGFLSVESEPGKGTKFKIYLPFIRKEADEPAVASPAAAPHRGTETVLLAEDDASVRKLIRMILEDYGYTVIEAVDGDDALRKFGENSERIQLFLSDVVMPGKNGKEAFDEIRKLKPALKVIFASGYTADVIHKKGILEENIDYITKPVAPTTLLLKVREVLDRPME